MHVALLITYDWRFVWCKCVFGARNVEMCEDYKYMVIGETDYGNLI